MQKIKTDMEKLGKVELQPKFDGKQMIKEAKRIQSKMSAERKNKNF